MFDFRAKLNEFRLMTVTGVYTDINESTKYIDYLYINKDNLSVKVNTSEVCEDLNFEFYSLNEENEYNKEDIPKEEYTKGIGINVMDLVDIHELLAVVNDEDTEPVTLESLFDSARNGNLNITYDSVNKVLKFDVHHWTATDTESKLQANIEIDYKLQVFTDLSDTDIFNRLRYLPGQTAITVMPTATVDGNIVYCFSTYDVDDTFEVINSIVEMINH